MKHFDKFVYFCRLQMATGDYDAHIPFLTQLRDNLQLDAEQSCRLALLYMAYYNEGSAWVAFKYHSEYPCLNIPIDVQRRNLYSTQERWWHIKSLREKQPWAEHLAKATNWKELLSLVGSVYGNGRWASYTTSELLMHMAGLDLHPNSFEVMQSSGPRKGLECLGLEPSEKSAELVHEKLAKEGIETQYSQLESLLCDWCGMNKGTFYAGRNIDRQQGRIVKVTKLSNASYFTQLWHTRQLSFPTETLGELNGWEGIDKARLKVYKQTGKVLAPSEDR